MYQHEISDVFPHSEARSTLRLDDGGTVRVGDTRITLDAIVEMYESGMTPEDMVRAYDTLVLADAHEVIAYYLRHRHEVQNYIKNREAEAAALRVKIESAHSSLSRSELLARRSATEAANASSGQ